MAEKITPEEKLLKLIETPSKDLKLAPQKKFRFNFSFFKLKPGAKGNGVIEAIKEKFKPFVFNFKLINQGLLVLSFLVTCFVVFDFIKERPNLDKIYASDVSLSTAKLKTSQAVNMLGLSDYISEFAKRDIFHFIPIVTEASAASSAQQLLADVIGNFKLVGIIWGSNPQAMIEDKKENKTMLLNTGDLVGNIKVKQIYRDKVILLVGEKEVELL